VHVLGGKEEEYGEAYTIKADYLISAVGQLNVPYTPGISGLTDFKGKLVHSARWNLSNDLSGQRVAIIGNGKLKDRSMKVVSNLLMVIKGATAIQIVPELAKVASKLTLFQRTPNWVMPRDDEAYPRRTRMLLHSIPMARSFYRASLMDRSEGFHQPLTGMGSSASEQLRDWCLGHMHSQLPDRKDLWKTLTPAYAPGCKRILISNDFYPTLLQENVKVETTAIKRLTPTGIETVDGQEIQYDCIILATGFRTGDLLQSLPISGLGGRAMQEIWKQEGVHALYGIGVEDMPNFSMLYGPNTNLAHNSIILMIEAQARYIQTLVSKVVNARNQGQRLVITPRRSRVHDYNDHIQQRLSSTSFADPKCQSWYKTEEGRITNNWYGTVVQYQNMLATVHWSDFDVIGFGAETLKGMNTNIGRVVEESRLNLTVLVAMGSAVALAAGFKYMFR